MNQNNWRKRRKISEMLASCGMVLIAVGLLLPLLNMLDTSRHELFRWIFAVGAFTFWAARCIPVASPDESPRVRRLRRMEFWAGACFGVAAFFWFYNAAKAPVLAGALTILRDTILFSLAGAAIQLIAAWMIYYRSKKEASTAPDSPKSKK